MLCVQEKVRLAISEKKLHTHKLVYDEQTYDFLFESERRYNTASLDACVLALSSHTDTIWDRWSSKESRNEIFLSQKKKINEKHKNFLIHEKKNYKSAVNICIRYITYLLISYTKEDLRNFIYYFLWHSFLRCIVQICSCTSDT